MISQGLALFDRLVVAIGQNPSKNYVFSTEERLNLLRSSIPSCERLTITHFDNRYLVDYAEEVGAGFILRGIRSPGDYEYERVMRHINSDMAPDINTVFLMPPREMAELSSSMVMGMVGPEGWGKTVRRYVPSPVFDALVTKHSQ
jgi:pantetheine-phosphate adenylyltransferase